MPTEYITNLSGIQSAHARIQDGIHCTPVLTSTALNELATKTSGTPRELFLKCENFQKMGAFKIRGGLNAVRSLSDADAAKGVVTHSSGNFAQAVALAARQRGVPAHIVMPSNAPGVKRRAVEGYGARVVSCEPNLQARQSTADAIGAETGATFLHPLKKNFLKKIFG